MANAAATRLSGPVLPIPNYGSASPNRINLPAVRSPANSVSVSSPPASAAAVKSRRSCMCSPTNHPGSFRCSRHKERTQEAPAGHIHSKKPASLPPSAVVSTGSGAAEGAGSRILARRAINPPQKSLHQRRAGGGLRAHPQPSRLSSVSCAGHSRQ